MCSDFDYQLDRKVALYALLLSVERCTLMDEKAREIIFIILENFGE